MGPGAFLSSVRRSRLTGVRERPAGLVAASMAGNQPFCLQHHHPMPPCGPGPSGLLGALSFCNLVGLTVLISLPLCGSHSPRLTFQHRLSVCSSASKILLTPSPYPFGVVPFVSLCFRFRGVSRLSLSYFIRSPITFIPS